MGAGVLGKEGRWVANYTQTVSIIHKSHQLQWQNNHFCVTEKAPIIYKSSNKAGKSAR